MKRILIGMLAVMMAMPVFAEDTPAVGDKTTTSQPYVKTQVDLKQGLIPAAGTNSALGDTVVTYTSNGEGEIGERGIYTGGTYDASTDADKLITASALNSAFTTLPETPTTTLECANQSGGCTLWTIVDQTAYGVSGDNSGGGVTTIDLSALVGTNGTGNCYKTLKDGTVSAGTCTTTPEKYGDWGTTFTYEGNTVQISGISACSSVTSSQSASNQSQIDADYATSGGGNSANTNPPGKNCYCKMTGPAESRWVYDNAVLFPLSSFCADYCAGSCGSDVQRHHTLRSALFGAVQQ